MLRCINLLLWLVAFVQFSFSQIASNPAMPFANQKVTITFDSSKEPKLGLYTGDLFAHTGVIAGETTTWQHVIGTWNDNTSQPRLTHIGNGIYELVISPDVITYYAVQPAETVKKIALVIRTADGKKQTNDLFIAISPEVLNLSISSPSKINVFERNETFLFSASTTITSDLKIYQNNLEIDAQQGTSITRNITIPDAGSYWLKVKSTQNAITTLDSVFVCIRDTGITQTKPAGLPAGIHYPNDQSATLIVYAPYKNNIFVTGDFNNWLPENNYQMKKDGDYFWLEIGNLIPQKEYVFQYLIDGTLKIGDAYAEKVSDPEDKYISSTTYPNLIPYPAGKADDRASVLQTDQTPFTWSTTNYTIPDLSKLSVYELLIRDFTQERTYKAVQAKLDYLKSLGINTIELMPFSEFEGNNSWGYNPNFYFAPDKAYGTKNDLKALIDECHKQGFVVIQDIVLNHSYNSSPMVKMYWNNSLGRPSAENPWFNEVSPNTMYSWGSDFNHESQATKDFVDRVTKYWMTEYHVDGFRFDFTKGFTNTPGDGGGYDASRIAILKRMADKIWEVNPLAIIILEHFADNSEEQQLAAYKNGMLIWGNANYNFSEAAMGYNDSGNSDFSWASYQKRGYSKPGLVAYMESHDEERQMYKTITYGNSYGSYQTQELDTALRRSQLATAFFLSMPGPKMIWQFGELGYDVSIARCEDGTNNLENCKTSPKPVRWNYLNDPQRMDLFDVYSAMLRLRDQFDVFTSGQETLSLSGAAKKIQLRLSDHNITLLGNFGVSMLSITPGFQHTGIWYEFFTGAEITVSNVNTPVRLNPGEYRLYSDQKLPAFHELTSNTFLQSGSPTFRFYPNPTSGLLTISSEEIVQKINVYSMEGRLLLQSAPHSLICRLNLDQLDPGLYLIHLRTANQSVTENIIKIRTEDQLSNF